MYKQLVVLAVALVAVGAVAVPAVTAVVAAVAVVAVTVAAGLRRTAARKPIAARATDTKWARVCGLHVRAAAAR